MLRILLFLAVVVQKLKFLNNSIEQETDLPGIEFPQPVRKRRGAGCRF
jgi:hypothetical protein